MTVDLNAKTVVLVYNTARYLVRFRSELIGSLQALGYRVIAIVPLSDPAVRDLEKLNVRCINLEIADKKLSVLDDLRLIFSLWGIFKRESPSIVFLFTIKPVIYGSIASGLAGIRHTFSMITGLGYAFSGGGVRKNLLRQAVILLYRIGLTRNKKVFFQNADDLDLFRGLNLIGDQRICRINGSGVDLTAFNPKDSSGKKAFVLVARMIQEKGVEEFVEAAREIKKTSPSAEFWLVGEIDGNPSAISHQRIADWEKEGVVRYLGHVDQIQDIYSQSIAFVLPTYYREGIPRTILEAMACGLPIITTDTPGCRETVVEGENGYLIEPRNTFQLVDRISRLLKDPSLARRMGRKSRELAEEKYDVRTVTKIIMRNILEDVESPIRPSSH